MNTQFKVGQQFKDSKGTVLTVKEVKIHHYNDGTKNTFFSVGFDFTYLESPQSTYIPEYRINKYLDSGELTEVKKLSAAERMFEWLRDESINKDYTQSYRNHCSTIYSQLDKFINEEKNG